MAIRAHFIWLNNNYSSDRPQIDHCSFQIVAFSIKGTTMKRMHRFHMSEMK